MKFILELSVWHTHTPPLEKPWKQGLNLYTSTYFAHEVITQFRTLFLNVDYARNVRQVNPAWGELPASGCSEPPMGASVFKPFVVSCRQFYGPGKDFFLSLSSSSSVSPSSHVTSHSHNGPSRFWSSQELASWPPCDRGRDSCLISPSLFAAGSPLKTQGTRHHLSVCDVPSCTALLGHSNEICPPCPTVGGKSKRQPVMSDNTQTNLGAEVQYFQRGDGRYWFTVAIWPRHRMFSTTGNKAG